jgi:hypothetical protein
MGEIGQKRIPDLIGRGSVEKMLNEQKNLHAYCGGTRKSLPV